MRVWRGGERDDTLVLSAPVLSSAESESTLLSWLPLPPLLEVHAPQA